LEVALTLRQPRACAGVRDDDGSRKRVECIEQGSIVLMGRGLVEDHIDTERPHPTPCELANRVGEITAVDR
jgi:hypothetical protein